MAQENRPESGNGYGENDKEYEDGENGYVGGASPELDLDGREEVPDQGRIPTETIGSLDGLSVRRTAHTGDTVEDAGDDSQKDLLRPLSFSRNEDFQGNEGKLRTEADYSRGSGWVGGKLWGEEALGLSSNENTPLDRAAPKGFDPSESQRRNREAISREGAPQVRADQAGQEGQAGQEVQGDLRDQGRDLGRRERITASQAFGRDVGASGLSGAAFDDDAEGAIRRREGQAAPGSQGSHSSDWTAVLGKLGGSSPGSQENIMLSEKFRGVKFPASREDILQKLPPDAAFKVRKVSLDLREAVGASRLGQFRNMNEIIDCVKDAIREAEHRELHPT